MPYERLGRGLMRAACAGSRFRRTLAGRILRRAAWPEDEEHLDGPGPDAADGNKAFDEFFVGQFVGFFERRDDAFDGLFSQIFHGLNLCAGKTRLPKERLAER